MTDTVLDCCNVSGVLMSASATPKSVLIGKYRQYEADLLASAKVACEKEKAEYLAGNRHVMTSQTWQDEVKRWVTADFVNVSRRVPVNCNSTFCSNAYLDYSVDSASLNNSEELHIRNFKPQTCVRRPQSLKSLLNLQISKWRKISKIGLLYIRNVVSYKYKRSQRN